MIDPKLLRSRPARRRAQSRAPRLHARRRGLRSRSRSSASSCQIEVDRLRAERNADREGRWAGERARARMSRRCSRRARRSARRSRATPTQSLAECRRSSTGCSSSCRTCCTSPCRDGPRRDRERRSAPLGRRRERLRFKPRDHVELGEKLGRHGFRSGARASPAARFVVLRGADRAPASRARRSSCSTCTRASTATRKSYVPYLVNARGAHGHGAAAEVRAGSVRGAQRARATT